MNLKFWEVSKELEDKVSALQVQLSDKSKEIERLTKELEASKTAQPMVPPQSRAPRRKT